MMVIELTIAAAIPTLPMIMTQIPLTELLRVIFRAVL
jgi:hypothetical protein